MDFLEWAKGRRLPKALQSRSGWAKFFEYHRTAAPHIHQIEPTNFCQYDCMMCPRGKEMSREIGYMDMDVYGSIIDELATFPEGVKEKEIELFHFGESLFHSGIVEMIQIASRAGLKPVLSINPAILTQEQIELIPEAKPFKVIISLDSLDKTTYKTVRGPQADLEQAVQNTELLLKSSKEQKTNIVIRMIVMEINQGETDHFLKFWAQRGGQVEFREFFPWNHSSLVKLGKFKKYPPFMPCPFPWQYMVIHWNGDVVPCCRDYNGDIVLGNVVDSSLTEIWSSKKYEMFREKMTSGKHLPHCCNECLSIYYTETLHRSVVT